MEKDFDNWFPLKSKIDAKDKRPIFHEREIWWCNFGINVGYEQDGKGKTFTRPALVYKKFHSKLFLAIPLSSQIKDDNPYYHQFTFINCQQSAIFQQIKVLDSKRLVSRMGKLPEDEFEIIKSKFRDLLC